MVTYIGIRPRDATYDKTYWEQNLPAVNEALSKNYLGCAVGIWI